MRFVTNCTSTYLCQRDVKLDTIIIDNTGVKNYTIS